MAPFGSHRTDDHHAACRQQLERTQLPDDVDGILAAYDGDARAALRAVLDEAAVARADMDRVLEHVSEGYVRGRGRALRHTVSVEG